MKLPIYLDYMATTPVDPKVKNKMIDYLDINGNFGNPSSEHFYGKWAQEAVEEARCEVAALINADPREIIFTSGATEANNLAIKGSASFYKRKGQHIVTVATEHKTVLDCYKALKTLGFQTTYLTPEKNGIIDLDKLKNALKDETILLSVMHVNNEIGVIQDIKAIGEIAKEKGIIFHVDASQSAGKVELNVKEIKADLISFSAHKIYGPKGIGALYVRRNPRIHLEPQMHGGGQEYGLRSGTLATHQIVGMGEAFRIAKIEMNEDNERILRLRNNLLKELRSLPGMHIHGDTIRRVACNISIGFDNIDGELFFANINKDIAISSRSACTVNSAETSHVLKAIGVSDQLSRNSIRISLGRFTKEEEIDYAIKSIRKTFLELLSE